MTGTYLRQYNKTENHTIIIFIHVRNVSNGAIGKILKMNVRERFALTFRHISPRLLTGSSSVEIDVLARANKVLSPEKISGEELSWSNEDWEIRISQRARLERENPEEFRPPASRRCGGRGVLFVPIYIYIFFFVFLTRVRANNSKWLMSSAPERGKILPGPSAAANYFLWKKKLKREHAREEKTWEGRRGRVAGQRSDCSGVKKKKTEIVSSQYEMNEINVPTLLSKSIICHCCNDITVSSV